MTVKMSRIGCCVIFKAGLIWNKRSLLIVSPFPTLYLTRSKSPGHEVPAELILSHSIKGLNNQQNSTLPTTLISANQRVRLKTTLTKQIGKQKKLLLKLVLFFRAISLPKPIQECNTV